MVGNDNFSNAPSVKEYVPQTIADILYDEGTFWNDVITYVLIMMIEVQDIMKLM